MICRGQLDNHCSRIKKMLGVGWGWGGRGMPPSCCIMLLAKIGTDVWWYNKLWGIVEMRLVLVPVPSVSQIYVIAVPLLYILTWINSIRNCNWLSTVVSSGWDSSFVPPCCIRPYRSCKWGDINILSTLSICTL
jgi:hypothetical protein